MARFSRSRTQIIGDERPLPALHLRGMWGGITVRGVLRQLASAPMRVASAASAHCRHGRKDARDQGLVPRAISTGVSGAAAGLAFLAIRQGVQSSRAAAADPYRNRACREDCSCRDTSEATGSIAHDHLDFGYWRDEEGVIHEGPPGVVIAPPERGIKRVGEWVLVVGPALHGVEGSCPATIYMEYDVISALHKRNIPAWQAVIQICEDHIANEASE